MAKTNIWSMLSKISTNLTKRDMAAAKTLTALITNDKAKLSWLSKASLTSALKSVTTGKSISGIINAVSQATGRVLTQVQAQKMLEAKLNTEVQLKNIAAKENVAKAAIDAGLWNNGINFSENAGSNASGSEGTTSSNSIGSYLGG